MTTSVSQGVQKLIWIMIIFFPLYALGRILVIKKQRGREPQTRMQGADRAREVVLAVFALFMFGLLVLTFENAGFPEHGGNIFRYVGNRLRNGLGVNFVPFRTIRTYFRHLKNSKVITVNILGNIVMFLPWGLGLPLLWKRYQGCLKVTLMSVLLPLAIEFIQLFIGRSVDIDDVILNFAGGLLGGLLYSVLVKIAPGIGKLAK